jgi:hypothetical protein
MPEEISEEWQNIAPDPFLGAFAPRNNRPATNLLCEAESAFEKRVAPLREWAKQQLKRLREQNEQNEPKD